MGAKVTIVPHLLGGTSVGQSTDNKTLGHEETIAEAISFGYVNGKPEIVSGNIRGVLKAMADGVQRDGDGRKIDNFVSIQPQMYGRLEDPCDDLDLTRIGVDLLARPLKDLTLDTSGWEIPVEGSTGTFRITSLTTGEESGVIVVGEAVCMNGNDLVLGANDTITWSVTGTSKSGTVARAKITGDATRLTIAGDAFAELNAPEYDGKTIVFVVKIGNRRAVKAAQLKVNA